MLIALLANFLVKWHGDITVFGIKSHFLSYLSVELHIFSHALSSPHVHEQPLFLHDTVAFT